MLMVPERGEHASWPDAAGMQCCWDLAEPRDVAGDTAPASTPESPDCSPACSVAATQVPMVPMPHDRLPRIQGSLCDTTPSPANAAALAAVSLPPNPPHAPGPCPG